jgi:hypothetical protein
VTRQVRMIATPVDLPEAGIEKTERAVDFAGLTRAITSFCNAGARRPSSTGSAVVSIMPSTGPLGRAP